MKLVDPHNSRCNVCSWNSYLNYRGGCVCPVLCRTALFCIFKKGPEISPMKTLRVDLGKAAV